MKTTFALAAAAALTFVAATAEARGGGRFDRIDANRDGRVTFAEFESFTSQQPKMRQLDAQKRAKRIQRRFQRLDEAKKGYLTPADFAAARQARKQRGPL